MVTGKGSRRPWAGSFVVLGLVCALAVGLGVGLWLVPPPVPSDLAAGERPTTAAVSSQSFDDERTVRVAFDVAGRTPLITGARGVVTATSLTGPGQLTSGAVALWVEGRPVLALHTGVPLYRNLALGTRGADVAALNQELNRLGLLADGTGDSFTQATRAAWLEAQLRAGVPERSAELSLEKVMWLPAAETAVAEWSVTLGGPVPMDGVVGQVNGAPTQLNLSLPGGDELVEGERILVLFGQETRVIGLDPVTNPQFLAALANQVQFRDLMLQQGGPLEASGLIRLVSGIEAWRVPPTALFGIEGRLGCVEVAGRAVPVRILGSGMGASLVEANEPLSEVAVGAGLSLTECPRP
ncbi:MAG: hypothetical protein LBL55_06750 [Propionibacteriaceae bacterium]|nr:hypothetical protein [Propionibacteriaceae bacterium]